MPTTAQEWAAFMALIPYYSACPASPKIRDRLLAVVRQCERSVLSRETLVLRAGLSFFADDFNIDLALMQFVREAWLVPIADRPFTFAVNLYPSKAIERCLSSLQVRPAASDRRLRLGATAHKVPVHRFAERLFACYLINTRAAPFLACPTTLLHLD